MLNMTGLVIRNTHAKYESPTYHEATVLANVKESKRKLKVTVKVMCSNLTGPLERSCHIMNTHAKYDRSRHKEHTCKV